MSQPVKLPTNQKAQTVLCPEDFSAVIKFIYPLYSIYTLYIVYICIIIYTLYQQFGFFSFFKAAIVYTLLV